MAREAVEAGAECIVVAGGDGTVNEVLNGQVPFPVPLGVLPGGTANVFAMEVGLGSGLEGAAAQLGSCEIVPVSLGRLTLADGSSRVFLLMAGIGLDARIVRMVKPEWKRALGKGSYWIGGFSQLGRRLPQFPWAMGGERQEASMALLSRVRNYGGDLEIARHASLLRDDMAVVALAGSSSIPYLKYFAGVLFNRLRGMKGVRMGYAEAVEIGVSAEGPAAIQVDGEEAGFGPARFEMVPNGVRLMLPKAYLAKERARAAALVAVG
jgi:diacylglycerol kinase family enzyme